MTGTIRSTHPDPAPGADEPDDGHRAQDASPPADGAATTEATAPDDAATGTTGTHRTRTRRRPWRSALSGDDGMSTVEYAIGTVAAAAFAAILYAVVSGDSIVGALTGIVQRALAPTF